MMRYFAIAILVTVAFVECSAKQPAVDDQSNPVLVSICQIGSDFEAENARTILALVYEIGSLTATLYDLGSASREPIAWMHYSSPTNDGFFEAQGGVLSTEITGKIFLFLITQPFFLVESLSNIGLDDYDDEIGNCVELSGDED